MLKTSTGFIKSYGIDILLGIIIAAFLTIMMSFTVVAQSIGVNNPAPHSKSLLDLTSADKGLLTPRLTQAQRLAMFPIADATAKGMLVYQTDNTQGFYYYDGTTWMLITNSNSTGWGLNGNTGTAAATNFIGTTDNQDVVVKANNQEVIRYTANNKIGIGTTTPGIYYPSTKLEIADETGNNSDLTLRVAATGFCDLNFLKHRGTLAAPATTVAGDVMGCVSAVGYNGSQFLLGSRISFLIDSTPALNDIAGSIRFYTSNNNLTPEAMRINSNGYVAIGKPNPLQKLDVQGSMNIMLDSSYRINNHRVLSIKGQTGLYMGYDAGTSNTTGYQNVFAGTLAGYTNTTGSDNTFVGAFSGVYNTTGILNTFTGSLSGNENTTGQANTFYGAQAGSNNHTGSNNTYVGRWAGASDSVSNYNTCIGTSAGQKNLVGYATFLGTNAGKNNTTGTVNTFIGLNSGYSNDTGSANAFLGYQSGFYNNGDYNTFTGYYAGYNNTNGIGNVFNGSFAGTANQTGSYNVYNGHNAGLNSVDSFNVMVGSQTGFYNTTGKRNAFFGADAGSTNISGSKNSYFGFSARGAASISNSGAFGYNAYVSLSNSIVLGDTGINIGINNSSPVYPLSFRNTLGDKISFWGGAGNHYGIGLQGYLLQIHAATVTDDIGFGIGSSNAFIEKMRIKGNGKVGIGTTTPGNFFTTAILELADSTGTNKDLIMRSTNNANYQQVLAFTRTRGTFSAPALVQNNDNLGRVSGVGYDGTVMLTASEIQYHVDSIPGANSMPGNITFHTNDGHSVSYCAERMRIDRLGNVGIGTAAPTAKLHVNGSFQISNGTQGAGKILLSDATGLASWTNPSTLSWGMTGNAATNPVTNFIGTTDNVDLNFRTNNLTRITIAANGKTGFGTTTPQTQVEINGALTIKDDATLTANAATFSVTVANRSYFRINSNAAPASRIITLTDGLQTGQLLIIECTATGGVNGIRMADNAAANNTNLATYHDMYLNDTITLIWNGTDWIEVNYSDN